MQWIGKTRRDGINWVQEHLEYLGRPLAEMTFFALVEDGKVVEADEGFVLTEEMSSEDMRRTGMNAQIKQANRLSLRASRSGRTAHRASRSRLLGGDPHRSFSTADAASTADVTPGPTDDAF